MYYHIEIFDKFPKSFCGKTSLKTWSIGFVAIIFIALFNSSSQTVGEDRKLLVCRNELNNTGLYFLFGYRFPWYRSSPVSASSVTLL